MFADAIEIDPRYADARYNLALTHLRLGEQTRASGSVNFPVASVMVKRISASRRPPPQKPIAKLGTTGHASF